MLGSLGLEEVRKVDVKFSGVGFCFLEEECLDELLILVSSSLLIKSFYSSIVYSLSGISPSRLRDAFPFDLIFCLLSLIVGFLEIRGLLIFGLNWGLPGKLS
jgi:hypothetical protein